MAVAVVDVLEVVDVEDRYRARAANPARARDLVLEALQQRAAAQRARQGPVLGSVSGAAK
jgi:hypothetical protein